MARENWGWRLQRASLLTEGLVTVYAVVGLWLIATLRPKGDEEVNPAAGDIAKEDTRADRETFKSPAGDPS